MFGQKKQEDTDPIKKDTPSQLPNPESNTNDQKPSPFKNNPFANKVEVPPPVSNPTASTISSLKDRNPFAKNETPPPIPEKSNPLIDNDTKKGAFGRAGVFGGQGKSQ